MLQGDHGVLAWSKLADERDEKTGELAKLIEKRKYVEHKVKLLTSRHLDLDLVSEQVKSELHFLHPDEIILPS